MKTALIFFRNTGRTFDSEYYGKITACFENGGIEVQTVEILSEEDDLGFKRKLEQFKDTVDNLVVFDGANLSFDLKETIAEVTETNLVENENAKRFLDAVATADGENYSDGYAMIPLEATVIPNIRGAYQGFILDLSDFTLAVLPSKVEEAKPMCDKYVVPYLEKKSGMKVKRLVLKYFGNRTSLNDALVEALGLFGENFIYSVNENNGDFTIDLNFGDGGASSSDTIRYVVGKLKENIYAEFETTLGERLYDVLRLKKLKLSVAESFTGGRVVSAIIANPGASEFVNEGIVSYSNASKIERLGVVPLDLEKHGAVSSVVAYQMAAGLIKKGGCDVAIATTGIAGPKSDNTEKPVGLCYIAVGTKDGVYTYKYNFSGTREEITETAKNTALFLAIKKLKNI